MIRKLLRMFSPLQQPNVDNIHDEVEPGQSPQVGAIESNPLVEIHAARDAAVARLQRLSRFGEAVNTAYFGREAANETLRAHKASEVAALKAWAESSGEEAPPSRNIELHAQLLAEVERFDREHEACVGARAAVESSFAAVRAEIATVQARIDQIRAQAFLEQVKGEVDELADIITDVHARHCRILGSKSAFLNYAETLRNRGLIEQAGAW
jgi:hypothetical protein